MLYALDVESAGLKGRLNLVQILDKNGELTLIRPFKEPAKMSWLRKELDAPENIFMGWNFGFDLWKLYGFYNEKKPFKCQVMDLWQHMQKGIPFKYYTKTGKSAYKISKCPGKVVEKLEKVVLDKINSIIPSFFEVKIKHSIQTGVKVEGEEIEEDNLFFSPENSEKDLKTLVTLDFSLHYSLSLKKLIANLFPDTKTIEYEDCFKLPQDFGWKENNKIPFIPPEIEEKYEQLWQANETILDDPNSKAWTYSKNDVEYLFKVRDWLTKAGNEIKPNVNDIVAHIVAYTKWHGFTIDLEKAKEQRLAAELETKRIRDTCPFNPRSFVQKKEWFSKHLLPENQDFTIVSLDRKHMKKFVALKYFDAGGTKLAKGLLKYASLEQKLTQLKIFCLNDTVYPDFSILGTITNRLSGRGGLNYQGITRESNIREILLLSQGADASSLEVRTNATFFKMKQLLKDLDDGIDLYIKVATVIKLWHYSYEEAIAIYANKDHPDFKFVKKMRDKSKTLTLATFYLATGWTQGKILNMEPKDAEKLIDRTLYRHYTGLKRIKEQFEKDIFPLDLKNWENKHTIDSMIKEVTNCYGDTLPLYIEKELATYFWKNSQQLSKQIAEGIPGKILRNKDKGMQKYENATYSCILGSVISFLKALVRRGRNFPGQSVGATAMKRMMVHIWEEFHVPMMNIHDELIIPRGYESQFEGVTRNIGEFIKKEKKETGLDFLKLKWLKMFTWADKS